MPVPVTVMVGLPSSDVNTPVRCARNVTVTRSAVTVIATTSLSGTPAAAMWSAAAAVAGPACSP